MASGSDVESGSSRGNGPFDVETGCSAFPVDMHVSEFSDHRPDAAPRCGTSGQVVTLVLVLPFPTDPNPLQRTGSHDVAAAVRTMSHMKSHRAVATRRMVVGMSMAAKEFVRARSSAKVGRFRPASGQILRAHSTQHCTNGEGQTVGPDLGEFDERECAVRVTDERAASD